MGQIDTGSTLPYKQFRQTGLLSMNRVESFPLSRPHSLHFHWLFFSDIAMFLVAARLIPEFVMYGPKSSLSWLAGLSIINYKGI